MTRKEDRCEPIQLPIDFTPHPVKHFDVERIVLSKGSLDTPERCDFVARICSAYPATPVLEELDTPHNRVRTWAGASSLERFDNGRRTLVLGVIKDGINASREDSKTCSSHWSFSVYAYCPYGCTYCYLPGTSSLWFSPAVRVYVNVEDIIQGIAATADKAGCPTAFVLGKLQDGLALDPLTAYSTVLVPFFAQHKHARQIVLTKSDSVERLLALEHGGHTILSWTLNPPEISEVYEKRAPAYEERVAAMCRCAEAGYPVRAVVMPFIPHEGWERLYRDMFRDLLTRVPIQRLTLGGLCVAPRAVPVLKRSMREGSALSATIEQRSQIDGKRLWFEQHLCRCMYGKLVGIVRSIHPRLPIESCHTL